MANEWANLATESDDSNFACAWAGCFQQPSSTSSGWANLDFVDGASGCASAGWASLGGNFDFEDCDDENEIIPAAAIPDLPTRRAELLATIGQINDDTPIAEIRAAMRNCTALVESAGNIQQIGECGPS